jgi:glyoxylase-like metal-dependent hydrolase (beta-lactamase superfamily II)
MFQIKKMECNPLQENCYVVSDETKECVIIDCGAYYPEELKALDVYLRDQQLKPVHLLATHGHLDHNFGNVHLFHTYGLKVEICPEDQQLVEDLPEQAKNLFGMSLSEERPQVGRLLSDGDEITFGNHTLRVLHTPGHSHGSCLYYCAEEKTVFTGDTLFRMSIGRTDFPEGSWTEMENSLTNVVAKLPKETIVLAGHGPQSTIADELQYNLYLR